MRTALTTNSIPKPFFYIDEGYSMTRTEAPKDLEGRGEVNLARTTPELPRRSGQYCEFGRVSMEEWERIYRGDG